MILIEMKIEARYLKKNSQIAQEKNCENLYRSNTYGFLGQQPLAFLLNGTLMGILKMANYMYVLVRITFMLCRRSGHSTYCSDTPNFLEPRRTDKSIQSDLGGQDH